MGTITSNYAKDATTRRRGNDVERLRMQASNAKKPYCPPFSSGENFWARGYFVSTVGLDEQTVRQCIRDQEREGERLEQLKMDFSKVDPPSGGS